MKKIAIITARAGSKGLPNKNVLLVEGKPLMAFSIEAALGSEAFEKVIVSTDSQEYIDLLSHYPIEFIKRDEHLASDKASSFVVLEDVLRRYRSVDFDYFVLLQPTSPLRTAQHIKEACEKFEGNFEAFDFLVSVSDAHKPTTLTRPIEEDESLKNFRLDYSDYARQQYHPEYSPNGAIFIAKPAEYLEQRHFFGSRSLAYFMDKEVSVDIDDRADFEYFYFLIQQRHQEQLQLERSRLRIRAKKESFARTEDLTFVGHSILAQWNVESLKGKRVNNLGISGISAKEYEREVLDQGFLTSLAKTVLLMMGTNDLIRRGATNESVLQDIQSLVDRLKRIREDAEIYFLEMTPVAFRAERNNEKIIELNQLLESHLSGVKYIRTYTQFCDKYGKLDVAFTHDGLHLNEAGYKKLTEIVEREMN